MHPTTTTTTAAPSSLNFCPECGNLLDQPADDDILVCNLCSLTQNGKDFENIEIVTRSRPDAFPSSLRNKRSVISSTPTEREQAATIEEVCPKCQNPEMSFHTMQLRSADEGQTVFYNCKRCGYKYSINS